MEKIKDELKRLRPNLMLIMFAGVVLLVVINFWSIIETIERLFSYLNVFFYGLIMAFIINIPMSFIENKITKHLKEDNFIRIHKRGIAITLSVLIFVAFVGLMFMFIFPEVFDSILRIISNIGNYFNSFVANIGSLLSYLNIDLENLSNLGIEDFLAKLGIDYSSLMSSITNFIVGTSTGTIAQIFNVGSLLFNVLMGFFICLYLLGSKETFIRQAKKFLVAILPNKAAKEILRVLAKTDDLFKEFLGGKFIELIIVWVMMYVSLRLCGISYVILLASMCALAVFIPYFGALVMTIISTILLLSVDPVQAFIFFIVYQVVQNIDGNLIYPKIMGNATGLHAVWILVSVFFFGGLLGPFGMIIAVPVTACIAFFASELVNKRLLKEGMSISEDTKYEDL